MKKNYFIENTRLREIMRRYTSNEHLIDACLRVSMGMIGFENTSGNFYREDRMFMKKFKRLPNDKIDNNPVWINYQFAQKSGPQLIKAVKEDLRGLV